MKAKLIKENGFYRLENITNSVPICGLLSIKNCDELFGVVDVEKLALDTYRDYPDRPLDKDWKFNRDVNAPRKRKAFIKGFNKAIELNKDKVFTLEDIDKAIEWSTINGRKGDITHYDIDNFIQSLQQPTEIEVEIEMESIGRVKIGVGSKIEQMMPKLDSEGCLILTKNK